MSESRSLQIHTRPSSALKLAVLMGGHYSKSLVPCARAPRATSSPPPFARSSSSSPGADTPTGYRHSGTYAYNDC
jgi:hypothetical protein